MKNFFPLLLLFGLTSFAQKQANTWYFGNNGAGLDFNAPCTPSVLSNGAMDGFEGVCTISDKNTGQLLFYTNSEKVWNRNHQLMPNSNLVTGGNTITQVLITDKPNHDSLFYIFTLHIQANYNVGMRYSMVSMNRNGGMGGLVYKDSLLTGDTLTEKVTAVRHSNGTDLWVIAHKYRSNKFVAYLVTASGVNTVPIISAIGKFHYDPGHADPIGEMKASPDGNKLAVVTVVHPNIELFSFNKNNGQVSNVITLPEVGGYTPSGNASGFYGLSFSANNQFLYATKNMINTSPGYIIQYNISSNDSATINNTRVNLFNGQKNYYSLKLAPDRKIYVAQNVNQNYLGVINNPDSAGLAANFVDNGINLGTKLSGWGLNNLMEYSSYCFTLSPVGIKDHYKNDAFRLYPNPSSNAVTLEFPNPANEPFELLVFDMYGNLVVKATDIYNSTFVLERAKLSSGLHYFQLKKTSGIVAEGKFLME